MPKLHVNQTVVDDNRIFVFENDMSSFREFILAVQRFGEPTIDFGGTFETDEVEWSIPSSHAKIISGMPKRMSFDVLTAPFSTATANRLTTYRDTIVTRFTDAVNGLRNQMANDTFTNEYIYNL
jgi:hypothetical protein